MTNKKLQILDERVRKEFLPFVSRPSRYIGGEVNQHRKDPAKCRLTAALCFPDLYEVGMSNTGMAILYEVLNGIDGVVCERVFSPWTDAEQLLRDKGIELFSLESRAAVSSFDVVGFSLSTELCYTNVLNMLDMAGLNVRSSGRSEDDPLIIAGGGMANCCEPLAEFIDVFVLGEAEEAVAELAEFLKQQKAAGTSKTQTLHRIADKFEWAYVPSLYEFEYEGQRITDFKRLNDNAPPKIKNAVVSDFENAPAAGRPIVPFAEAIHERVSVEIMRGCPGRCHFCQASYCRRPVRFRSVQRIVGIARQACEATGFDTVSLLSLSTADYPKLGELVGKLGQCFKDEYVGISLPSLRVDQQLKLVPELAAAVRKSGLTIAVEAASERLREVVNKPLKNEDLFAAVESAYKAGWQKIKLYFMVGLPGETDEDIEEIVALCNELSFLGKKTVGKKGQINVAVSWFVPKPHTPFGWLGQQGQDYFFRAKEMILQKKRQMKARSCQFKFHHVERSVLESAIGRGDRRLGDVIETAWKSGAKFDLWNECFDFELWQRAFAEHNMDMHKTAQRQFAEDEYLPWEHLGGPEKDYLLGHLRKSMAMLSTYAEQDTAAD